MIEISVQLKFFTVGRGFLFIARSVMPQPPNIAATDTPCQSGSAHIVRRGVEGQWGPPEGLNVNCHRLYCSVGPHQENQCCHVEIVPKTTVEPQKLKCVELGTRRM